MRAVVVWSLCTLPHSPVGSPAVSTAPDTCENLPEGHEAVPWCKRILLRTPDAQNNVTAEPDDVFLTCRSARREDYDAQED